MFGFARERQISKTMANSDPADLLRTFVARGDEAAFRAVVERCLPLVYSTALRQVGGNTPLAEDAAQEVFIASARKAPALAHRPTLAPWLFQAARLAALRLLRREQRRLERETRSCVMPPTDSPAASPDWERLRPLLDTLLSQLPRSDQEAIFLRYFDDRGFAEIGRQLGIAEDAARQRTHRALDKLNALLARRGLNTSAAVLGTVLSTHTACAVPTGLASLSVRSALTASAAGAAAALPTVVISAMKLTPPVATSMLLLVVAGVGTALLINRVGRSSAAEVAALRAERIALQAELDAHRSRSSVALPAIAPVASSIPPPSALPSVPASGTPSIVPSAPLSPVDALCAQIDRVLANPDLKPAFVDQVVRQLVGDQLRFFRLIGVTPDQEAAITREAANYANTLLRARAERIGGEHFAEAFAAADDHSFRQVQNILGEETFARLKALKSMSREYTTADQIAARLYYTDGPLDRLQADRIASLLAHHRFNPTAAPSTGAPTVGGRSVSSADYAAFRQIQNARPGDSRTVLITDAALADAARDLPLATVQALTYLQAQQISDLRFPPTR